MSKSLSRLLAAMTCAASLSVYAADQEATENKHHKPPQAALDACKDQAEKSTCQFTGRNNETVTGTCKTPRNNDSDASLVCRPEHRDRDKDHSDHSNSSPR